MEAVDALAAARVHLVGHGRRARLALGEAFAGELGARHDAQGFCKRGRARADLVEHRDAFEIECARVDLAGRYKSAVYAEVLADFLVELNDFFVVAVEEGKLV